jgi:hypothetical protein
MITQDTSYKHLMQHKIMQDKHKVTLNTLKYFAMLNLNITQNYYAKLANIKGMAHKFHKISGALT